MLDTGMADVNLEAHLAELQKTCSFRRAGSNEKFQLHAGRVDDLVVNDVSKRRLLSTTVSSHLCFRQLAQHGRRGSVCHCMMHGKAHCV
mmetsp:Transcript_15664/g.49025  ORF Transcript_15664/g.49025 Transcript_15664/m.49025 type:complete len:89 (-) Transcript_15664:858-1124(-)